MQGRGRCTAVKFGVPKLEIALFTNVNKQCPICDTKSVKTEKLLGNAHICPSQCPSWACSVYKFGYCLYTRATGWALLGHYSYCLATTCAHLVYPGKLLVHYLGHHLHTTCTLHVQPSSSLCKNERH